mmetsp:Transcript_32476/g.107001  ORF Transcript_32476/g.107001 Transcript_32476/m.107001 type:complete len:91 (-) Transcript_32476:8-280(-)
MLLLGATLQGCGCEEDKAKECIKTLAGANRHASVASAAIRQCHDYNEMTRCLKLVHCCDYKENGGKSHAEIVNPLAGTTGGGTCKVNKCT